MQNRTRVHHFQAHRATFSRLTEAIVSTPWANLGVAESPDLIDGYLPASQLESQIRALSLQHDAVGPITLRTTSIDFNWIRDLISSPTVTALDAATSQDPRVRGVGRRRLAELLDAL